MKNIDELQYIIGFVPTDTELFNIALTHPSYNSSAKTTHRDYERLEYIGDSVLGFVVADLIYKVYPKMEPGNMSKLRSVLVRTKSLSDLARKFKLYEFIKVGDSIPVEQLCKNDHILENVFESLIGAVYLEKGIEFAYNYVKGFMLELVEKFDMNELTDSKSKLQEEMQAEYRGAVHYELVNMEGPAHDRTFTVQVMFNDIVLAYGTGKSKKAAEEDAAKKALEKRSTL